MTSRYGVVEESSLSLVLELWQLTGYDGPQPYNFIPNRRERANEELPRPDGLQSQLNGWSEENEWRVGEVSRGLIYKATPLPTQRL